MFWTVFGIIIVIVSYVFVIKKNSSGKPIKLLESPVNESVPLSEAQTKVEKILSTRNDDIFVKLRIDAEIPQILGPVTKDFFRKYEEVCIGGFQLAISQVGPSDYASGFISIGHAEDWDIVQKPGSDQVSVLEGGETIEGLTDDQHLTIYHLILSEAQSRKFDVSG